MPKSDELKSLIRSLEQNLMNWCLFVRCQLFVGNLEGKASSIRSKLQNTDVKTAFIISLVGPRPRRNTLCHSDPFFFTFCYDCAE